MNRTTYEDLFTNYFPKDGEPGNQMVFARTPTQLKTEMENIGVRLDILFGIDPADWSSVISYKIGNIIKKVSDGKYYEAVVDNLNSEPPSVDWQEITPIEDFSTLIVNQSWPTETDFTATQDQTTFIIDYTVGKVQVFLNGIKLKSTEYTATNGISVILGSALNADDWVQIITN